MMNLISVTYWIFWRKRGPESLASPESTFDAHAIQHNKRFPLEITTYFSVHERAGMTLLMFFYSILIPNRLS